MPDTWFGRHGDAGVLSHQYETGKNRIAASKLVLAAEALKCDVTELVGEKRDDHPGTARLVRAWSNLDDKKREAITSMIEAFE